MKKHSLRSAVAACLLAFLCLPLAPLISRSRRSSCGRLAAAPLKPVSTYSANTCQPALLMNVLAQFVKLHFAALIRGADPGVDGDDHDTSMSAPNRPRVNSKEPRTENATERAKRPQNQPRERNLTPSRRGAPEAAARSDTRCPDKPRPSYDRLFNSASGEFAGSGVGQASAVLPGVGCARRRIRSSVNTRRCDLRCARQRS
jgi:hypothetical protein